MESITQRIKGHFKGEILENDTDLQRYENDASIFELRPALVLRPKDVEDIKLAVTTIAQEKEDGTSLSLTPRAAGTGMAGGALSESVVLDVQLMNKIISVIDTEAIVEPGVYYRDLERATLAKDRIMPSYPASKDLCAVGGMVGANASGEKTLTYGSTEEYVRRLNVVLADGNEYTLKSLSKEELEEKKSLKTFEGDVYRGMYKLLEEHYDDIKAAKPRVSKNSTGYALWNVWDRETFDLTRLFTGSEGTLGITTQITFGLVKPKTKSRLLVIFLKDLHILPTLTERILSHKPESFESYDDNTFKFAIRFFPDIVRSLKAKGLITLGLRFIPEFLMVLTGGVPKLVLLAEFTGDDDAEILVRTEKARDDIANLRAKTHITTSRQDAEKYWTVRHESFNLLRHHGGEKRTAPFIDDIIVDPKHLPTFLPRLNALMDEYKLTYTIAGHIGDGNLHIIPLMDLRKQKDRDTVLELGKKVFDLVFEFGGSMSAEHNDGIIRTPFLKDMYGEKIVNLFEETKMIFDPRNIFNPGKKVFGPDISYIQDRIDRVY